jgi:hypothetical protein
LAAAGAVLERSCHSEQSKNLARQFGQTLHCAQVTAVLRLATTFVDFEFGSATR